MKPKERSPLLEQGKRPPERQPLARKHSSISQLDRAAFPGRHWLRGQVPTTLRSVKGIPLPYLAASWLLAACAQRATAPTEAPPVAAPSAALAQPNPPLRAENAAAPAGALDVRHAVDTGLTSLGALYDDAATRAAYSRQHLGVTITGRADALLLLARLGGWWQGAEFSDPPPLSSIRLASLQGLDAGQAQAMVRLFVETVAHEEQLWLSDPASLANAILGTRDVLADPRVHGVCRQPCVPWPWQTRWSILETSARAAWREGDNTGDAALLDTAIARAREALLVIPVAEPVTVAVTERLLAAALQTRAELDPDLRGVEDALAVSRRALSRFTTPETRVDRLFTMSNIEEQLRVLAQRDASPARSDEALALAKEVVQGLDERRAPLAHARAMMQQAAALADRYESLDDRRALTAARDQVQQIIQGLRADASPILLQRLYGDWCRASTELGAQLDDASEVEKGAKACERALALAPSVEKQRPRLSVLYGSAMSRLGDARSDVGLLRGAVTRINEGLAGLKRPNARAQAFNHLAVALSALSEREAKRENLGLASAAFERASQLLSKRSDPMAWAKNMIGYAENERQLGWFERSRYQLEAAKVHYGKAVRAIDEALTVLTKNSQPARWASLQQRAGDILARDGELSGQVRFNQALMRYQLALSVNRRASDPAAYAKAQFGIGVVHLIWADQSMGLDHIRGIAKKSVTAFREALAIQTQLGMVKAQADTKAHLADAISIYDRVSYRSSCEPEKLLHEAVRDDPKASGLWEPAATTLARYREAKSASKCVD